MPAGLPRPPSAGQCKNSHLKLHVPGQGSRHLRLAVGALAFTQPHPPPQLAALNRSNVALQELTVQAILNGDTRAAFHAVALDPLTAGQLTLAEARAMFDELFAAHREALPGFDPLT